jgi:hypothetical protein
MLHLGVELHKPSGSARWRPELLQQHSQGFTQLEPVAGGVCEVKSALSSKASILDSSSASRLFSISSSPGCHRYSWW